MTFIAALFSIIISFLACGNAGQNSEKAGSQPQNQPYEKQIAEPLDDVMMRGQAVYIQVCATCHQTNGSGVPMMFPPISESDIISGDPEKLIKLIFEGMSGPVEIKGEEYNSIMPPQNNLDDQQIADLLTFLRKSFGNSADPISAEEVASLRK